MPLTFPSHAAAVLPLKLWRPRIFDGVALVIGSTSQDLLYPFAAIIPYRDPHRPDGLLWWCLPVTVLITWVVRRAVPTIAVHLPAGGGWALRDYGALAAARYRWYVTAGSALLGAATHLVWDSFAHTPDINGWAVAWLPVLNRPAVGQVRWYEVIWLVSTVVGAMVALAYLHRIGRHRLIRRWHGEPPPAPRSPALFWGVVGFFVALYPLTWPFLTHLYEPHVQGVRLMCLTALGLLAGAAAVRLRTRGRGDALRGSTHTGTMER